MRLSRSLAALFGEAISGLIATEWRTHLQMTATQRAHLAADALADREAEFEVSEPPLSEWQQHLHDQASAPTSPLGAERTDPATPPAGLVRPTSELLGDCAGLLAMWASNGGWEFEPRPGFLAELRDRAAQFAAHGD